MLTLFFQFLAAHALCDYPLQGDFLARGKNHRQPIPGVPWGWCLGAHALIHGLAVYVITGSVILAFAETLIHALIDFGKCAGAYDFSYDQSLHILCKVGWALIATSYPHLS